MNETIISESEKVRWWEKVQHSECKCLRSRLNQQGTLIGPNINQEDEEGRGRVWVRVWDPHPSLSNLNQTKMPLSLIKATVGSPAHLGPNNAQTNNVTIAQRRGHSHSLLYSVLSSRWHWHDFHWGRIASGMTWSIKEAVLHNSHDKNQAK